MRKTESVYVALVSLVMAGIVAFLAQKVASLADSHLTAISIGLSFGALGAIAFGFAAGRGQ